MIETALLDLLSVSRAVDKTLNFLTITVSPSTFTTLVQLSMPVVAVWYSSNVLSFSLRKREVFPTPSSPSKTTLYVGPRLGAAMTVRCVQFVT